MKKKSAIVLCVCFIFLMGLTGCTKLEPQDLYGNWTGNWEYEGSDIEVALFFDADGNYTKTTTNDGEKKYEIGKYTIEGSKVVLKANASSKITEYKYKSGNLVNNKHDFVKEK